MRRRFLIVVGLGFSVLLLAAYCNKPPVALFSVDHVAGPSPLAVQFDGSASFDPDGQVVAHSWDFGDGERASGEYVNHTFVSGVDRSFTVKLTVTDNLGTAGTSAGSVFVFCGDSESTLFFDDFEEGADPAWVSFTTNWSAAEGSYQFHSGAYGNTDFAYVSTGSGWEAYSIEFDTWIGGTAGHRLAVLFYVQEDFSTMVRVWASPASIVWEVLDSGQVVETSDVVAPGLFNAKWQHIRIAPSGGQYTMEVDGLLRSTFNPTSPSTGGMPGIGGSSDLGTSSPYLYIDNFKVTAQQ